MTRAQNATLDVLPNVLRTQTIPNTLGGIGPPTRAAGLNVSLGLLAAGAALAVAVAAVIMGRAA